MSDRQVSIKKISRTVGNLSCTAQTVTNRKKGTSFAGEHGSFAGAGYWQDWALAVNARTGFIAFHFHPRKMLRTSSALILEVVEFRRVLESNLSREIPEIQHCINPWMDV
jgi:hypothetical protein